MALQTFVSPHHETLGSDRLDRWDFAQHVDNEVVTAVVVPSAVFQGGMKVAAAPDGGAGGGRQDDDRKGNQRAADHRDQ